MIGHQFGHYEVLSRLGSGGMGVVYLGRDTRLDRRVAIKVLADGRVSDELARTRFRREAQALSRLNHPNIATIYDFNQQDGCDFLVMEYIDGVSLRDIGPDPLPAAEVVRLGTQLAEALVAAHGAGVVHLDLKPGNMMLTSDGRLKVLDFGIARLHTADVGDASTETGTPETAVAASVGSPPYIAPEQVAAGPVDGRTDIYSAGATLYELATGRRVFEQPRGPELFNAIVSDTPVPPSRHTAGIPPPLEGALMKALEKEPLNRQQTAGEMLSDFHAAGAPPSPALTGRGRGGWRRREIALTAAAVLVVTAVTGYALWPASVRATFHARDFVLVGDLDNRTDDPLLSRTVQEALSMSLQQSQFVNVVSRDRVVDALRLMKRPATAALDDATARAICQREGVPALISGSITRSGQTTQIAVRVLEADGGGVLFAGTEAYEKPEQLFARVDSLARRLRETLGESMDMISTSSQPLQKATTGSIEALRQYSKAVEARAMGQFNGVEAPLLAALQLDPGFVMAHLKLGDYYMDVAGDDAKAMAEIQTAYRLRDRVTDREKYFIAAQYFSAHQQFEQTRDNLKILTSLYPDDPEFRYELAIAFYALEDLPAAISELRQAIRVSPHGARAHGSLVLLLARNNQPEAALEAFSQAGQAGVESPYLYWASGLAHVAIGRLDRARTDFDALGRGAGYFAHLGRVLQARALLFAGQVDEAAVQLQASIELTRREGDPMLEFVARLHLGRASVARGDRAAARQQAMALASLISSGTARPAHLRDAGSLALAAGNRKLAEQHLARLGQLEAAAPTRLLLASRRFLEGAIALYDGRFIQAAKSFEESDGFHAWFECRLYAAEAYEGAGDWSRAADAWRSMLKAKGQIIQDGFPGDLRLAETRLARATAHLTRKDR